jgi:large subunit ribosomal protein L17
MLNSLIKYEQITTTLPKAKELKPQIDKAITLGKRNNLQSRKNLFSRLESKTSVNKLVKILSQRYEKRKGGYCRVIRSGFRYGDDAPMAVIELVDRDLNAKKIDVKKKTKESEKTSTEPKKKDTEQKKLKSKK